MVKSHSRHRVLKSRRSKMSEIHICHGTHAITSRKFRLK